MTNASVQLPLVRDLVPHDGAMRLLDRIVRVDEQSLTAELTVDARGGFAREGQVGAWVGVEYMAQSIAAFAGFHARRTGDSPQVGFLVGCRAFSSRVPFFSVGSTLLITVTRQLEDARGLSTFAGEITDATMQVVATATLSVYRPPNMEQFMAHHERADQTSTSSTRTRDASHE